MTNIHPVISREAYEKTFPGKKLSPDLEAFYNDFMTLFVEPTGDKSNNKKYNLLYTEDEEEYILYPNYTIVPMYNSPIFRHLFRVPSNIVGRVYVDEQSIVLATFDFTRGEATIEYGTIKDDVWNSNQELQRGNYKNWLENNVYGFDNHDEVIDIKNRLHIEKGFLSIVIAKDDNGNIIDAVDTKINPMLFYDACVLIIKRSMLIPLLDQKLEEALLLSLSQKRKKHR